MSVTVTDPGEAMGQKIGQEIGQEMDALAADRADSAAASVDLPWSMWPIVPTLTWGLVRLKVPLAMTRNLRQSGTLRAPRWSSSPA